MHLKSVLAVGMAAALVWLCGCGEQKKDMTPVELPKSFETTVRVKYQSLETILTIYKKPMNCAVVTFGSPASLRDMRMTFYTDRVSLGYKELTFDFDPDKLPGKAASAMLLAAINTALTDQGVTVTQNEGKLEIGGAIEEGRFLLTVDAKNGNLLRLSIPEREFEAEILNFKILE